MYEFKLVELTFVSVYPRIRVSELIGLKLSDINFSYSYIRCMIHGRERVVPFGGKAQMALEEYVLSARKQLLKGRCFSNSKPIFSLRFLNSACPSPSRMSLCIDIKMHIRAMKETGLTAADEMLYPENWRYFMDILSYVAIGARSV
mgnify:CR=1 FL=1